MFDGSCLLQNEIINAGMAIAVVSQPTPPHLCIASFVSQSWTGALVLECVVALLHFSFTDWFQCLAIALLHSTLHIACNAKAIGLILSPSSFLSNCKLCFKNWFNS